MRLISLLCLVSFSTPLIAQTPIALTGATLVDGTGRPPVPNAVVVIQDDSIVCAGPRAACTAPRNAQVQDLGGKWIIPGLVDAHVHFAQTGWVDGRPDALDLTDQYPYAQVSADLRAHPERFFRVYLCSGVTSVFDVGGPPWSLALQTRTATSSDAPRVKAAGPLLSTVDFRRVNLPGQPQMLYMTDEAMVRRTVREHAAAGAAAIKVWYIMPPEPPDTARVSALVHAAGQEARAVGLPLIVHATGLWEAKDALRAGAHVLVHSVWEEPVDEEFLALARQTGAYYTPTIMVPDGYRQVAARHFERGRQPLECVDFSTRAKALATDTVALDREPSPDQLARRIARTKRTYETALANLKRVYGAGIPVAMGTDAGNPLTLHGASVFIEMEAMQEAGLTPMEVLVASTKTGAAAMGLARTGTVTAGWIADMVVLDADPLADIHNVRQIDLVIHRGHVFSRTDLEASR